MSAIRKELNRLNGIDVLSINGRKATIEVLDSDVIQTLVSKGFKVHKEECNIFLVIKPE